VSAIRTLLVDDGALFRDALRSLLAAKPEIAVIGEAANGAEALELAAILQPDVIVMDVRMPGIDGVEATRRIRAQKLPCGVLLLTTFDDDSYVFEGLAAGANGYLLKDACSEDLLRAIQAAARGESFLQPSIATRVIARLNSSNRAASRPPAPAAALSERERAILRLVAKGSTNREIGSVLGLTEGTIKNQLSAILDKLSARDRAHAVFIASEHGLL
jgi:DNA-binding NarL/FixJ family response regulator